jgi:hypothetical protein
VNGRKIDPALFKNPSIGDDAGPAAAAAVALPQVLVKIGFAVDGFKPGADFVLKRGEELTGPLAERGRGLTFLENLPSRSSRDGLRIAPEARRFELFRLALSAYIMESGRPTPICPAKILFGRY